MLTKFKKFLSGIFGKARWETVYLYSDSYPTLMCSKCGYEIEGITVPTHCPHCNRNIILKRKGE